MPGPYASVKCVEFGGCVIVVARGRIDVHQIRTASAAVGNQHIVLDFRRATSIHPLAASVVASISRRVRVHGGSLRVVTHETSVRTELRRVCADGGPRFYEDIGEALEAAMTARDADLRASEEAPEPEMWHTSVTG